jgi:antitoxin (DNA-binding transcriptional repressor) of toxin-antitoxin stability system
MLMVRINEGLKDLIRGALGSEPVPVGKLNQDTSGVLASVAKAGQEQRSSEGGPSGATIITFRGQPAFLLVPLADTPEYMKALAERSAQKAAELANEDPDGLAERLDAAIESGS